MSVPSNACHCGIVWLWFLVGRNGQIGTRLRRALRWWQEVLWLQVAETREWVCRPEPVAHLFLDAASTPARCAAVLFIDGDIMHTDAAPSREMLDCFQQRNDKQITGLEMFAICLGLSTFQCELAGRVLVIHSDNTGMSYICCRHVGRCLVCQAQSGARRRVQQRRGIITAWSIPFGPRPSCKRSTSGWNVCQQTTTWPTSRQGCSISCCRSLARFGGSHALLTRMLWAPGSRLVDCWRRRQFAYALGLECVCFALIVLLRARVQLQRSLALVWCAQHKTSCLLFW